MSAAPVPHKNYIQRLYRQALRTAYDHYAFRYDIYRQHCLAIRARFEENRNESNLVRIEALVRQTEEELEQNKHVRPFKYPTAVDGVKHGRNKTPPIWLCKFGQGNWESDPIEFEKIK